eukprot:5170589-Amphidinium_carterae.1
MGLTVEYMDIDDNKNVPGVLFKVKDPELGFLIRSSFQVAHRLDTTKFGAAQQLRPSQGSDVFSYVD